MLPILHLNGYKIANPTILGRIPDDMLLSLFRGYGYEPIMVAGSEPSAMHQRMAAVLDKVIDRNNRMAEVVSGLSKATESCSTRAIG